MVWVDSWLNWRSLQFATKYFGEVVNLYWPPLILSLLSWSLVRDINPNKFSICRQPITKNVLPMLDDDAQVQWVIIYHVYMSWRHNGATHDDMSRSWKIVGLSWIQMKMTPHACSHVWCICNLIGDGWERGGWLLIPIFFNTYVFEWM